MTRVGGFDGGYVIAISDTTDFLVTLLFTPDFFVNTIVMDTNLDTDPWSLRFRDASTGWISGGGSNTNSIFKYTGLLTSIRNTAKSAEKMAILPNPTSSEALVKLPELYKSGVMRLMIYNVAGKLLENKKVENVTGWTKLNGSAYNDGVYVVQVVSEGVTMASIKWVVKH
jgi:hypothetical protein